MLNVLCGLPAGGPWAVDRLLVLATMWSVMTAAMLLPCAAVTRQVQWRGYAVAGLAGALLHWGIESLGLMGDPQMAVMLAAILAGLELRKWVGPASWLIPAMQMVCLALLGDPMSLHWMAVVTLWMLADALTPDRGGILCGIRKSYARVNCALASFRLSPSR